MFHEFMESVSSSSSSEQPNHAAAAAAAIDSLPHRQSPHSTTVGDMNFARSSSSSGHLCSSPFPCCSSSSSSETMSEEGGPGSPGEDQNTASGRKVTEMDSFESLPRIISMCFGLQRIFHGASEKVRFLQIPTFTTKIRAHIYVYPPR